MQPRPADWPLAAQCVDNDTMTATASLTLRGDFIELDKLLKATGMAESGGAARMRVAAGEVRVDGQVELRKTAKIRAGQRVEFAGHTIAVLAAE
jgi:ribosome-associated protein